MIFYLLNPYNLFTSIDLKMINIQPTLIGKVVKIRPLLPQDLEGLYKAASDEKIWEQHPDRKRHERDHFIEKFFKPALKCKGALIF